MNEDDAELTEQTVHARTVSGSKALLVRGVGVRAVMFIGGLVFARLIGPADIGAVALGLTVIAFGNLLADGGLGAGLIRRREPPTREELQALLGWQLSVTLVLALVGGLIAAQIGRTGQVAATMLLALPIASFQAPGAIMLERSLRYRPRVTVELVEVLVWLASGLTLVLAGLGVWGLALATVARAIAGAVTMALIGPVSVRPRMSWVQVRGFLGFGARFQAIGLVNLLCDQGMNVLVVSLGGLPTLGYWTIASRVMQLPFIGLEASWRISYPAMARLRDIGSDVAPIARRLIELVTIGNGLLLALLAASSADLVPVAFGSAWHPASAILPPACAAILIAGGVSSAAAGILYSAGQTTAILLGASMRTLAWFGATAFLWSWLGVTSVGWGWLAGGLVEATILGVALKPAVDVPVLRSMMPGVVAFVLSVPTGTLAARLGGSDLARLGLTAVVTAGVFAAVVGTLRPRALSDLRFVLRSGQWSRPSTER